tara:strand:+ start:549 stop:1244 length:696 start_codon:yes stop_codon:yes gene_type:complete
MKVFLVSYRGESGVEIEADSIEDAYMKFLLSNNKPQDNAIRVVNGELNKGGEMRVFPSPHDEYLDTLVSKRKVKEERLDAERKVEEERLNAEQSQKRKSRHLAMKIEKDGFRSLEMSELVHIESIVKGMISSKRNFDSEEKQLVESALGDTAIYRFLNLKNKIAQEEIFRALTESQVEIAKSLGAKLSSISEKTGGIKTTSMVTGMVAARHLGEELAEEDEGGDMDFGGFD